MIRQVRLRFLGPQHKAAFLSSAGVADSHLPLVQRTAARFADIDAPYGRAEAIHTFGRDCIRYVRDLGGEEFADSEVILSRGFDDCDGKQRVVIALCTAAERMRPVGLEARAVCVFPFPDVFSHIAVELRWPKSTLHPRATCDGWVRSETILDDCPLGSGVEAARRDRRGRVIFA